MNMNIDRKSENLQTLGNLLIRRAILEAIIRQGELEQDPLLISLEEDVDREHPRARLQLVMIEERIQAWEKQNGKIPAKLELNIIANQPRSAADEDSDGKPPAQVVNLKRLDMRAETPKLT